MNSLRISLIILAVICIQNSWAWFIFRPFGGRHVILFPRPTTTTTTTTTTPAPSTTTGPIQVSAGFINGNIFNATGYYPYPGFGAVGGIYGQGGIPPYGKPGLGGLARPPGGLGGLFGGFLGNRFPGGNIFGGLGGLPFIGGVASPNGKK